MTEEITTEGRLILHQTEHSSEHLSVMRRAINEHDASFEEAHEIATFFVGE